MTVIPYVSYFSSLRDWSRLKWPEMEGRGQTLAMTKKRKMITFDMVERQPLLFRYRELNPGLLGAIRSESEV